jgi:molecular chaperone DnaK
MTDKEVIVGIDLGTTNSEIAAFVNGQPQLLGPKSGKLLPSCVAMTPDRTLLVGEAARNQQLLYPERTVRSIKRKMGESEKVILGDQSFRPEEISSLILRELCQWAQQSLGVDVHKAVITVPAYFSDVQRNATQMAGQLAGLEVVRILNEPTAASLAYGLNDDQHRTVMIYDLGGGTFDVSIVSIEKDVIEVLASHGNNHLGGDDFDQLLLDQLVKVFKDRQGIDLRDYHPASYARLRWAAEEAKRRLSFEPYVQIREDAIAQKNGKDLHLDMEFSRQDYEGLIHPLLETTLESVSKAMSDAHKSPEDIDEILLVGGSTRTPLIQKMLEERIGVKPRQDIHPDLCVALGAGVLASRLAGHDIQKLLVDVSPFSFGPSYLGVRNNREYPYCYRPIIHRNTPLPITRTESYYTAYPNQTSVQIEIFQGENEDALKNIPVGDFMINGLTPTPDQNEVLCRMSLDLDGILKVSAIEKRTGKSKQITISNALSVKDEKAMAEAREKLAGMHAACPDPLDQEFDCEGPFVKAQEVRDITESTETAGSHETLKFDSEKAQLVQRAGALLEKSRGMMDQAHDDDKEEMVDLHERIEEAIRSVEKPELLEAIAELEELLFFVEGRQ